MNIEINKLTPQKCKVLQNSKAIYICDFRALGGSFDHEIPAMWKYENIAPWILQGKCVAVNEDFENIKYFNENNFVVVKKDKYAKVSVVKRLEKVLPFDSYENVDSIYAFVPHPDIDSFAMKHNLHLNYTYDDFQKYNSKLEQKKLLKNLTPSWNEIYRIRDLSKYMGKKFFLKKSFGSGGYSVSDLSKLDNEIDVNLEDGWFVEKKEGGESMSVQCYKEGRSVKIFGLCKQILNNGKEFTGGEILNLEVLEKDSFLIDMITGSISSLNSLIEKYDGFFGIDFLYDTQSCKYFFLEANVRLTAMSIPVLLSNLLGKEKSKFLEDVVNRVSGGLILTYDMFAKNCDILS